MLKKYIKGPYKSSDRVAKKEKSMLSIYFIKSFKASEREEKKFTVFSKRIPSKVLAGVGRL